MIRDESGNILGEIDFAVCYSQQDKKLHFDCIEEIENSFFIRDVYDIEVHPDKIENDTGLPKVYVKEKARIDKITRKYGISLVDLHISNQDYSCCLGIDYCERTISVITLFKDFIIPFFYRLSYVEKYGFNKSKKDLWDAYSHGEKGISEYYREIENVNSNHPGRNDLCPCGSGEKYKYCHLSRVEGVWAPPATPEILFQSTKEKIHVQKGNRYSFFN